MKSFRSRAGAVVAVSAAAMSMVMGLFVPYGYPWPSLAWVVLACAAGVWVAVRGAETSPSMSSVIDGVEGEPARATAASKRGVASTRVIL